MSGFSFNSTHSDVFNLTITKHGIPSAPSFRETEEVIPGLDGIFDFGTELEKRIITLECEIKGDSFEETQELLRQLFLLLNPKQGVKTLVLDADQTAVYNAKLTGDIRPEYVGSLAIFTLTFKTADPYSHVNVEEYNIVKLWDIGDRWENETTLNIEFTRQFIGLDNLGIAPVKPVIKITGAISNFTLTNRTTNKSLTYNGSLTSLDTLIIEIPNGMVKKNGVTDSNMTGDITTFDIGLNANDLLLTSENSLLATITFDYNYVF